MKTHHRRGKFTLTRKLLQDYDAMSALMQTIVVMHCESNFATDTVTYYAYSPYFGFLEEGEEIPEYEAIITVNDKVYSVDWVQND